MAEVTEELGQSKVPQFLAPEQVLVVLRSDNTESQDTARATTSVQAALHRERWRPL